MSAASSLKHSPIYGFSERDHSSSSSLSSYSPLRRLQHLTTMVSQPDLVLPLRDPERSWEWGRSQRRRELDSSAGYASRDYCGTENSSKEDSLGQSSAGPKKAAAHTRGKDAPAASRAKKSEGRLSNPPSPAFSPDSNNPFANGFLPFESSLFGDDNHGETQKAGSRMGGKQETVPQSAPTDLNSDSQAAVLSAKVVTRSQSSGQRRRYWDGSDDEWDSDTELFLLEDSYSRHPLASFTFITDHRRRLCFFLFFLGTICRHSTHTSFSLSWLQSLYYKTQNAECCQLV